MAHKSEHCGFGSAIPPKIAYYLAGNLSHFGNHWVKRYNHVFA